MGAQAVMRSVALLALIPALGCSASSPSSSGADASFFSNCRDLEQQFATARLEVSTACVVDQDCASVGGTWDCECTHTLFECGASLEPSGLPRQPRRRDQC